MVIENIESVYGITGYSKNLIGIKRKSKDKAVMYYYDAKVTDKDGNVIKEYSNTVSLEDVLNDLGYAFIADFTVNMGSYNVIFKSYVTVSNDVSEMTVTVTNPVTGLDYSKDMTYLIKHPRIILQVVETHRVKKSDTVSFRMSPIRRRLTGKIYTPHYDAKDIGDLLENGNAVNITDYDVKLKVVSIL